MSNYGFNILQIETTAACNICSFCPYPLKDDKNSKLDLESIFNLLDQLDFSDERFKYLTFSQFNEPLLDGRIFDIMKYAKSKGPKILFITNGLLLNKEKNVKNLIDIAPDIKISLQVLDSSKHKDARGLNMELEKYVKTITSFCKNIRETNINLTIDIGCNFNDKKISFFIRKFLGMQIGDPSVPQTKRDVLLQLNQYFKNFYEISDEKYKSQMLEMIKFKESFFKKSYIDQEGYNIFSNVKVKLKPFFYGRRISNFYAIDNNFKCDSKILGVLASGAVVPCCLAYDEKISMGKIQ